MKINEVAQPSTKAIFESLKSDSNHSFSESTLMKIAESVSRNQIAETMSVESFLKKLDEW
jgi:hypothetical protein